jgi:hypothetical protein
MLWGHAHQRRAALSNNRPATSGGVKTIHKQYERSFLLEATKLTRLLEVIHDCLRSEALPFGRDRFHLFLSGDRTEEATTLEEVFAVENSKKHAIKRLLVIASAGSQSDGRPENEVQVDFDSQALSGSPPGAMHKRAKILVTVRSDDPGWASTTLSAVEEQIERTRFQDMGQRGALVVLLILLLLVVLALLQPQVVARTSGQPCGYKPQTWTAWKLCCLPGRP